MTHLVSKTDVAVSLVHEQKSKNISQGERRDPGAFGPAPGLAGQRMAERGF
jgi:hypothetical protein